MSAAQPRTWFVTGASAGFGRVIVTTALAHGDRVVATARRPSDLDGPDDRLLRLRLDVTDHDEVEQAVSDAEAWAPDGVDVLVNNAGHGHLGAVEELSTDDVASLLAVNLLGVHSVTRAVLPHMRTRGRGHVVQMSSVGGVIGNPGHAAYAMSKFGLEGLSSALAGEVAPFGIRVTLVEPGPFRTEFAGRSMQAAPAIEAYRDTPAGRLRESMPGQHGAQPGDPQRAAEAIVAVVEHPDPPLRLPMGAAAVRRIRESLEGRLSELAQWEKVALDTDFPETRA
ncbi:SDR family NAD(P)-dependent oxidoreductase [Pseudonocardia sp. KRD291]|uniref:SDR family NAD(P)-dependent oxidoreductase n=1 Tax=Pseudonocardia sp. KRD291 TaxID=2792007 RepID=UPI001C4A4C14|nr:SDR family NAD(P)-dependent oxidoreductase [Pseudonocardia sp. KRD291]MBW0101983.1 SDR family NAD(P)-dependent oxidoreductase [Pseudonocardia sp. KRD291]